MPRQTLTDLTVALLRREHHAWLNPESPAGEFASEPKYHLLSAELKVSKNTIYRALTGRTFKHLPQDPDDLDILIESLENQSPTRYPEGMRGLDPETLAARMPNWQPKGSPPARWYEVPHRPDIEVSSGHRCSCIPLVCQHGFILVRQEGRVKAQSLWGEVWIGSYWHKPEDLLYAATHKVAVNIAESIRIKAERLAATSR